MFRPQRQEGQRVEVAVRIGCRPQAHVHVRNGVLGRPRRADCSDDGALVDASSTRHGHRAEVDERHRVAVGRFDRDRQTVGRNGAGEGDHPSARCRDRRPGFARNVDTAVLTCGVRVAAVSEVFHDITRRRHVQACAQGARTKNRSATTAVRSRDNTRLSLEARRFRCQRRLQSCYKEP